MRVTILGCGASGGVPMIGGDWGACDPANPRNRRLRVSILVEQGATRLLVDTSPDLRQQLLAAEVAEVDAVLFTHDHADHTHGINELRMMSILAGRRIPVFANRRTLDSLTRRFAYAFERQPGSAYPPIAEANEIDGPFAVGGIGIVPFAQDHGGVPTLGFRFGPIGYSTDAVALPDEAFAVLAGLDTWIVGCLRYDPHPTHAHLDLVLDWISRLAPRRTVLTHMGTPLDYDELGARCPRGVEPGYDGMVLEAES
jgi:phosphoribosyl 1,2-cyclic phosphate phosphodiesterase